MCLESSGIENSVGEVLSYNDIFQTVFEELANNTVCL